MFKILTCLALVPYALSVTSGTNSNNDYIDRNNNNVQSVISSGQTNNLSGLYNFNEEFSFPLNDFQTGVVYDFNIDLQYTNSCPFSFNDRFYYLRQISINYLEQAPLYNRLTCHIRFYFSELDHNSSNYWFDFSFSDGSSLTTIIGDTYMYLDSETYIPISEARNTYFDINDSFVVNDEYRDVFYSVFTHDDNSFVETYNGYYNFDVNLSSTNFFSVIGSISFNSTLAYSIYGTSANKLYSTYYDSTLSYFQERVYDVPFDKTQVYVNNALFNNVKISTSSKQYLETVGIFSYVKDSSFDDTSLPDLILTIADIPVYLISQFLNFELFGFNLFVACASLVTLLVVIFVVRKLF